MRVKYVPDARVDEKTPFVVGGVYAHKTTKLTLMLTYVNDGGPYERYAFVELETGNAGCVRSMEETEAFLCFYDHLPGAYIAIPKEA